MDWTIMLAYISGSVDQELLLRNEYLVAENRVSSTSRPTSSARAEADPEHFWPFTNFTIRRYFLSKIVSAILVLERAMIRRELEAGR